MAATREVASEQEPQFARSKHIQFIKGFFKTESDEKKETPDLKQLATAYLKLSGLYWGVMALELVRATTSLLAPTFQPCLTSFVVPMSHLVCRSNLATHVLYFARSAHRLNVD